VVIIEVLVWPAARGSFLGVEILVLVNTGMRGFSHTQAVAVAVFPVSPAGNAFAPAASSTVLAAFDRLQARWGWCYTL